MAGSPRGLRGGRVPSRTSWRWPHPCSPKWGQDRAWPGVVTFGGCCHPPHPLPGLCWPTRPVAVVTASLSPGGHSQGREERGTRAGRQGGPWGHGGGPLPPWVPRPALLSPRPGKRCPQAVPARGVCSTGGCPPHAGPRRPPPWDTTSLPRGPHRLSHRTWTKSVAGDRDAPSLESRWMCRYPGDGDGG